MPVKKQTKNKLEKEKQIYEYIGIGVMIVVSVLLYKYIMLPWFPDMSSGLRLGITIFAGVAGYVYWLKTSTKSLVQKNTLNNQIKESKSK